MDTKGPKMIAGEFAPEGRVRQTLKDTRLMMDQVRKLGQDLPLLKVHAAVLEACVQHGEAESDNSMSLRKSGVERRLKPDRGPGTRFFLLFPV